VGNTIDIGLVRAYTATEPLSGGYFLTPVQAPSVAATGAVSAGGNEALTYSSTGGQSIPTGASGATMTSFTKVFDRLNANFVASTGTYTAPVTGYYQVSAQASFASVAMTAGVEFAMLLELNGSSAAGTYQFAQATATTYPPVLQLNRLEYLTAGQTLALKLLQTTGAALLLQTSNNWFSITQIP